MLLLQDPFVAFSFYNPGQLPNEVAFIYVEMTIKD